MWAGRGGDGQGWHEAARLVPAATRLERGAARSAPGGAVLPGECRQHVLPPALPAPAHPLPRLLRVRPQVRKPPACLPACSKLLGQAASSGAHPNSACTLPGAAAAARLLSSVLLCASMRLCVHAAIGATGRARACRARRASSWTRRLRWSTCCSWMTSTRTWCAPAASGMPAHPALLLPVRLDIASIQDHPQVRLKTSLLTSEGGSAAKDPGGRWGLSDEAAEPAHEAMIASGLWRVLRARMHAAAGAAMGLCVTLGVLRDGRRCSAARFVPPQAPPASSAGSGAGEVAGRRSGPAPGSRQSGPVPRSRGREHVHLH